MNTSTPDSELESELQELYILVRHWQQDIGFMEEELQFFKNVLNKYQPENPGDNVELKTTVFGSEISKQEKHLTALKTKIPDFLIFLEPFIGDIKKDMDLGFLAKYNQLQTELQQLFTDVKATKVALFSYTEGLMTDHK
ncbi:hypothetical protein [Mucilaginibacter flavidus]|uniref:hypothetical protein n=1 Tax=Mucilaginibacter flavidus TaxID=2949309 RepID=UPI002093253F|nr:hypothetical protein [Mucilaginibacter flavidus]MCO5948497.1 hypothetical protein [Mucilaginibacter flavidus]